jgi:hypothetical protein
MTARDQCQSAEDHLAIAQDLLRNPSPEGLDRGIEVLCEVAEILERLVAGTSRDWNPAVFLAVGRIHKTVRGLQIQIAYGTNLVRGWRQRQSGAGYTRGGLPEFAERGSRRSFEI